MTGQDQDATTETRRGRVRRLLIDPLEADGMRPCQALAPRYDGAEEVETLEAVHVRWCARLADDLAYMSDAGLAALHDSLRFGAAPRKGTKRLRPFRDHWPGRIAILELANALERCPLDKVPGLRSWFASVEGPKALDDDIAVETLDFILTHKRPPYRDRDIERVREAAWARRREIELAKDRIGRGLGEEARLTVERYRARRDKVKALIAEFRAGDVPVAVRHAAPEAAE